MTWLLSLSSMEITILFTVAVWACSAGLGYIAVKFGG